MNVINEMHRLCGDSYYNPWTMNRAARYVSGEDGILIGRNVVTNLATSMTC